MYSCAWLSHKYTPKHTFDGAKVHKLSVNMGKNKRFIAIIQRNMEKAMRHVRPPITFTPIIIYKGCHMAVYRSSPTHPPGMEEEMGWMPGISLPAVD